MEDIERLTFLVFTKMTSCWIMGVHYLTENDFGSNYGAMYDSICLRNRFQNYGQLKVRKNGPLQEFRGSSLWLQDREFSQNVRRLGKGNLNAHR